MSEHEIKQLPELHFVGLPVHCPSGKPEGIGETWDKLFARHDDVPQHMDYWGVSWGDGGSGFHYLAAHQVPPGTPTPDGMISRIVPAAKYARWPFEDDVQRMSAAFHDIFENLMPQAGLKMNMADDHACLEYYPPDCFDEAANTIRADLYVSVE